MPLSIEDVARAVALVEDGRSIRYAARAIHASYTTVHRAVLRFQETQSYTRRPGSGRPRATTARDDRFLVNLVLRNRHSTAPMARNRLAEVRGNNVSDRTVRRRLKEAGLGSFKPATGPELLAQHRVARLQFARQHVDWTEQQWGNVLFSDESRVALRSPDSRGKVWRRPGERYFECTFSPRTPFHKDSIMVWAGISFQARTELVFVENGSLTAHRYIEEILSEYVVPYAPFIGDRFMFMDDNAAPHAARIVSEYFEQVEIHRMIWPARSPDLNPIEHIWDMLKKRIRSRAVVPENVNDLRIALREEWENIPQTDIQATIRSMHRRMEAVIRARGGNTRY